MWKMLIYFVISLLSFYEVILDKMIKLQYYLMQDKFFIIYLFKFKLFQIWLFRTHNIQFEECCARSDVSFRPRG